MPARDDPGRPDRCGVVSTRPPRRRRRRRLMLRPIGGLMLLAVAGQASSGSYTIRWGDTLSSIASQVGVPTRRLADENGLRDPDRIRAGQRLVIPGVASSGGNAVGTTVRYLPIEMGDTLASLARRGGLPPRTLAARNGIENGRIYYGAALRVTPYRWEPSTGVRRPYTVTPFRCPVSSARFMNDWGLARSGGRHHAGTDLFAHRGTPVRAPVMGTAERAPNPLGGRAVTVVTGAGVRLYFAHLERYGRVGHVHPGDVIGYVGDSGGARGGPPHVHVEVRPHGLDAVNPYPTLRAACR